MGRHHLSRLRNFLWKHCHNSISAAWGSVLVAFLLFSSYAGILRFDYPVPPGDDGIRHMSYAREIQKTGFAAQHEGSSFDPPGFHLFLAALSTLSGQEIVPTTVFFTPFLMLLAFAAVYLAVFFWTRKRTPALLAVTFFGLFSPQPGQIYEDGTYLNLTAALVFFVIGLAFLVPALHAKSPSERRRMIGGASLFFVAVFLSHSLSSVYVLVLLLVLTVMYGACALRRREIFPKALGWIDGVILLALPLTWPYFLKGSVEKILSLLGIVSLSSTNILQGEFAKWNSALPALGDYYWLLGKGAVAFSVLALPFFLWSVIRKPASAKIVLGVWILVLFLGSRTTFFQLPSRFARDLAIPLSIFVAVFLWDRWMEMSKQPRRIFSVVLLIFAVVGVTKKMDSAFRYHPQIRVQSSDIKAMEWIRRNTQTSDTILAVPRTIVAGDWGSYLELLTDRKTIDGSVCPPDDDGACDPIFDPTSELALRYYEEESIDYVYAGKRILGSFVRKDEINFHYTSILEATSFLKKETEFFESRDLGKVTIFKVDHDALRRQRAQAESTSL